MAIVWLWMPRGVLSHMAPDSRRISSYLLQIKNMRRLRSKILPSKIFILLSCSACAIIFINWDFPRRVSASQAELILLLSPVLQRRLWERRMFLGFFYLHVLLQRKARVMPFF